MRYLVSAVETWKPSGIYSVFMEANSEKELILKYMQKIYFGERYQEDYEDYEDFLAEYDPDGEASTHSILEYLFDRQTFLDYIEESKLETV